LYHLLSLTEDDTLEITSMKILSSLITKVKKPFIWFRTTRKRNKVFAIIGVLIVAGIIAGQIQAATAKPPYVTQKVVRGDIEQLVSETGNVQTAGRVDVDSTATGIIEEMYVNNNDTVVIGQDLFKVRSTATDAEKAAAYATYQSAVSAVTTAQQTKDSLDAAMWTSRQGLLDAKNARDYKNNNTKNPSTNANYTDLEKQSIDDAVVIAEKSFTAAEKKYKEADVAVVAAQAQLTSAKLSYQATQDVVVKSPTNGTVTNLSYRVGDKVTAGAGSTSSLAAASGASAGSLSSSSSSPVLTIANLVNYTIKLAINEVDIPNIKVSQTAEVTLDAFPERKFDGLITHVDSVGTNTQGVITYNVVVDITDPITSIRPGMTANVDISVDKVTNVLTVSNSAVKPYKGGRAVRVYNPSKKDIDYIPVEIGLKGDDKTEIVKGVSEGQEVITSLTNDQVQRSPAGPF
jgi:multidrug efflux pump subunit AcrA (membrane-fusion protein)